jgi:surface polysaccharide O-acyltransferase-like enzyme
MNRNAAIDQLKLALTFMVVALHCGMGAEVGLIVEHLLVNGVFRVAVPVFLLINGYYFFGAAERGQGVAWLRRVGALYATWMVIYAYLWLRPIIARDSFESILHELIFGYYHLWYLPGMLFAAALMLLFRSFGSYVLLAIVLVLHTSGVLIQYFGSLGYIGGSGFDLFLASKQAHRNFLLFCFPFFCLGYLLGKYNLSANISSSQVFVAAVLGLGMLIAESTFAYVNSIDPEGFDNYFSLIVVCPAVFLVALKKGAATKERFVSDLASAIYFSHILTMMIIVKLTSMSHTPLAVITILLSVAVGFALIKLNRRWPIFL